LSQFDWHASHNCLFCWTEGVCRSSNVTPKSVLRCTFIVGWFNTRSHSSLTSSPQLVRSSTLVALPLRRSIGIYFSLTAMSPLLWTVYPIITSISNHARSIRSHKKELKKNQMVSIYHSGAKKVWFQATNFYTPTASTKVLAPLSVPK
jgi:hypothetical protein